MKPKAKRFRIRRSGAARTGASGPGTSDPGTPTPATAGTPPSGAGAQATAAPSQTAPSAAPARPPRPDAAAAKAKRLVPGQESGLSPQQEIDAIKRENLTGRQLRVARREAQKHGLNPSSDLDAVRLLRKNGIDPFKRSDLLELVVTDQAKAAQNLPAAIRHAPPPSPHVLSPDERAREVQKIQQDIARRRRRKLALLLVKLAFFVFLPTALAGYYYFFIATPMYAVHSEFVIQQASPSGGSGGLGGLFGSSGLPTTQDSITVQSYLTSRDAMRRLDREHNFKAHFQQAFIDPIQRLDPKATNEAAYRTYLKRVKIGFDPTEGIVKMDVIAASPQAAVEFSKALIKYAEEQVDQLTHRLREGQMMGARKNYQDAEKKMTESQAKVLALQEKKGILSADAEISSRMQQISAYEVQLRNRKLALAQLKDNPRPNRTKVQIAEKSIARLEAVIAEMRGELTGGTAKNQSLAQISGELKVAQADLATRQLLLSQALQQLENARIEANRQVRYLSLGVAPVAPDEPTYPKAFEDTVLAFLLFAGIYLMISLTASVLREQIAA